VPRILLVTEKLLTGYDAPVLYAMYLDKPMRDHTLLQAIARVNRPYENEALQMVKPHGFVLDFVGIFDKLEKALAFDSDEVNATGGQRSALLPERPTIVESGLPGYEMLNWLGMFAPAGTPRTVVEKLSSELVCIVRMPNVSGALQASGAEPSPLGLDEFAAFVKSEVEKWAKVVAATGMTAN